MSAPCLTRAFEVKVSSGQYILNGGSSYISQYGMADGVYAFDNVPAEHPIAILSSGGISYSGDSDKKFTKAVDGVTRNFFYGNVKVTVSSNFGTASLYCYYHGYMGGQNMLIYQSSCALTQFNDRLVSSNSRYRITCQNDGNFVVYENSTGNVIFATSIKDRLWSPNQSKNLQIQDDGNFVVYDTSGGSNVPVFSTNSITATAQKSPGNNYRFSVQDDGNIVLYDISDGNSTPVLSFNDLFSDVNSIQSIVGSNSLQLAKNVASEFNIYNKIYNACSTIKFRLDGQVYTGSGSFITLQESDKVHGLYMTAAHCVMELVSSSPGSSVDTLNVMDKFYIRNPLTNKLKKFNSGIKNILGYDGLADVAIIKTGIDLSGTDIPLQLATNLPNTGDLCYMCGNPGGFDNLSFSQGHIRDNNNTDIGGYQAVPSLFITTPGIGGNSGSPLVNIDGKIIGIYTFGYGGSENLGGGSNLDTLNSILPDLVTLALNNSTLNFRNKTTKNYLSMDAAVPDGFALESYYNENEFPHQGMVLSNTPSASHPFSSLQAGDLLLSYTHDGVTYPLGSMPGQYAYGIAAYLDASKQLTITYRRTDRVTRTVVVTNWHVDYPELSDNPLAGGLSDGNTSLRENRLVINK